MRDFLTLLTASQGTHQPHADHFTDRRWDRTTAFLRRGSQQRGSSQTTTSISLLVRQPRPPRPDGAPLSASTSSQCGSCNSVPTEKWVMGVEKTKGLRKRMKERVARKSIMVICISSVTEWFLMRKWSLVM